MALVAKLKRKNPLAKTPVPLLPPGARSRKAHDLTRAAAHGRFALHRCGNCGTFCYPAPEACPACLGDDLAITDAPATGTVLSVTNVELPASNYFRERAPWLVGLVKMDCGPTALCHLHPTSRETMPVELYLKLDEAGQAVLYGAPKGADLTQDKKWREMTAHPKNRRVLITDGRHPITLPLVEALIEVGAEEIYVGVPDAWVPHPHLNPLKALEDVFLVPLDLSDERSVENLARDYGAKIEILINTADYIRPGDILAANQINVIKEAMERVVFGTLRLAQAIAPVMRSRGSDGARDAVAWVNLLSVFGQAQVPDLAAYSVSQAAAQALSLHVRAELAQGGVRLLNVISGPTESEWYQHFPQPKIGHKALVDAVMVGLTQGLEDIVVGDFAKDIVQRLESNPKALERELLFKKNQGV